MEPVWDNDVLKIRMRGDSPIFEVSCSGKSRSCTCKIAWVVRSLMPK